MDTSSRISAERRPQCDVVLVGLGATSAVAAEELTRNGAEVVAIEAGPRYADTKWVPDELHNKINNWMANPKAAQELPSWRASAFEEARPGPRSLLMMNGVGGATVHYEGVSPRFCPWNFQAYSATVARYGRTAIPPLCTVTDWPFGYSDLESSYSRIEQVAGICGVGSQDSGPAGLRGDPFEGHRSSPYPMPPLRRHGWSEVISAAGRRLGWHPFPQPTAINSVPFAGRPACTYCGYCSGNGCYIGAKNTADLTFVRSAEDSGRLSVETSARVLRIETDAEGLASGVTYLRGGRAYFQPARAVLVGTFVFENVRLLLTSASGAFPRGLANNAGQVGRHFMVHLTPQVWGWFPGWDLNLMNGQWAQGVCLSDWNADNFDHNGLGFISGGLVSAHPELRPISLAANGVPPWVRRWGSEWKSWLQQHARSVTPVGAQLEALSYEDNMLDLDPVRTDPLGVPVIRVTYRMHENERRAYSYLQEKMGAWLDEAGAARTWTSLQVRIEGRHSYGGTRMGADPATSVVDSWCFAHEVPNLGILGASNFPTAGGVNPTLTAQAVALRSAEHLVAQWRKRSR